jgi:hypothetical protein
MFSPNPGDALRGDEFYQDPGLVGTSPKHDRGNGELVFKMERREIERQTPRAIAAASKSAFDNSCCQGPK